LILEKIQHEPSLLTR